MTAPTSAASPLLPGNEMTIVGAAAHRESLLKALPVDGGELFLDLSGVSEFDSSGVQLLLSLRHSLVTRGARLHLVAASEAVRDALQVFGIGALFPAAAT